MLFLMNDVVLDLALDALGPRAAAHRYRRLSLDFVTGLGAELYGEIPLLHAVAPERARRLGVMITAKAPRINAALFLAPHAGCDPDEVTCRLDRIALSTMDSLFRRQQAGELTPLVADAEVWKRLAA
jgi:hypothetical protein